MRHPRTIILKVRHAPSVANSSTGILWGGSAEPDTPLTPAGVEASFELGRLFIGLPIVRIWYSGMKRGLETGESLIRGADLKISLQPPDARLEEFRYGAYQGMSKLDTLPILKSQMEAQGDDFTFPEGESFRMLRARVGAWMDERAAADLKGIDLVIGHGHAIRAAISHVTGQNSQELFPIACDNLSLTAFMYVDGHWFCLGYPVRMTSRADLDRLLTRIDILSR